MKRERWLLLVVLAVGCGKGRPAVTARPGEEPASSPVTEAGPAFPRIASDAPFVFAVVGDNRGDSEGNAATAFVEIVRRLKDVKPAFVLNTGDLANGYKDDGETKIRKLWKGYKDAIGRLDAPFYHVPGNHDIFDETSRRLWKELWGATHYAFDAGNARFIALDTESQRSRIDPAQFDWLRGQLDGAGKRHVFLFFHKPLFPVDGHVGQSLDEFPEDRDRLHELFLQHRSRIKGVFQGHEHLYHFEERDGVPYFIVAGGGAPLYVPPELGGFYHFLVVKVDGDRVGFEVRKITPELAAAGAARRIAPGAVLEGWESPRFWYTWDQTVNKCLTAERFSQGKQGLQVNYDFRECLYPVLSLPLNPVWDLGRVDRMLIDVYLPEDAGAGLTVTPRVKGGAKDPYEAPAVGLKPGWNTVAAELDGPWLPPGERSAARELEWALAADKPDRAGRVVFDNFRLENRAGKGLRPLGRTLGGAEVEAVVMPPGLVEGWEGNLLWGAWDQNVVPEATAEFVTEVQVHQAGQAGALRDHQRPVGPGPGRGPGGGPVRARGNGG